MNIKANKLIQLLLITLTITGIVGFYFYINSQASVTQKQASTDGLIGYWDFEEISGTNIPDRSGNGYDGTLMGDATVIEGKIGQGVEMGGDNGNYVNTTDIAEMDNASELTISTWVSFDNSAVQDIFGKYSGFGSWIGAFRGAGWPCGAEGICVVMDDSNNMGYTTSGLTTGQWQHITVVFDGTLSGNSNRLKVYFDGIEQSLSFNGTIPAQTASNSANFNLGLYIVSLYGKLDETRLYNRALSAAEVSDLYEVGQTKINASQDSKLTDGLLGYWTLDGNDMDWSAANAEVRDQVGTNHGDATTSGMSNSNAVIGKVGQALSFNGSSEYVEMTGFTQYVSPPLSWSAWIKLNDIPTSNETPVYKSGEFQIRLAPSGGSDTTISCNQDNTGRGVAKTVTLNVNEWYHIACSINVNSIASNPDDFLYINGVDSEGISNGFAGSNYNLPVTIGKGWASTNHFNGHVDEFRLYDRAISGTEATEIYNLGKSKINASQETKLTDGLVGNWTFDGNHMDWSAGSEVLDQSPSGNDGSTDEGASNATAIIGKIGQALNFDGNDYVNLASTGLSTVGNGDWSASAWFNLNSFQPYTGLTFNGEGITFIGGGGNRACILQNNVAEECYLIGVNGFNDKWTHVAVTRSGTSYEVYINGIENSVVRNEPGWLTDGRYYIGRSYDGTDYYIDGKIDEVRVYNRALSSDEITQLYNLGK